MLSIGRLTLLLLPITPAVAAASHRGSPEAQGPTQVAAVRVIGVVEVPRLFGAVSPDWQVTPPDGTPLVLRREPAADSPVVVTLDSAGLVESAEFAYEQAGALVYGRDRNWSLLRARDGTSGWMAPADGGQFHALRELLADGVVYLTDAWDGSVAATPGAVNRVAVPPDPRRRIVGYLEPQVDRKQVVLEPGEDPAAVRAQHRASGYRLGRPRADGTRILELEVGTAHPVRERPDRRAPVIAVVETNRPGYVLAATQSVPSLVPVFNRQAGWFEVALRSDEWRVAPRVWLGETLAWRFQPLTDPADAERFVARAWGPLSRSVRVAGFRSVGDRLWVEIEVLSDSPCATLEEPATVARGWIPVHAADSGAPTVWFHSRGC